MESSFCDIITILTLLASAFRVRIVMRHERKVRERRLGTGSIDLLITEIKVRNFAKSKRYGNLNNRKDWKPQHRPKLSKNSDYEILDQYNAEMRGFAEYYKLATNFYKGLGLIYYIAEKRLVKTLANKQKTTSSNGGRVNGSRVR